MLAVYLFFARGKIKSFKSVEKGEIGIFLVAKFQVLCIYISSMMDWSRNFQLEASRADS